jgi:hypothetical protein
MGKKNRKKKRTTRFRLIELLKSFPAPLFKHIRQFETLQAEFLIRLAVFSNDNRKVVVIEYEIVNL